MNKNMVSYEVKLSGLQVCLCRVNYLPVQKHSGEKQDQQKEAEHWILSTKLSEPVHLYPAS